MKTPYPRSGLALVLVLTTGLGCSGYRGAPMASEAAPSAPAAPTESLLGASEQAPRYAGFNREQYDAPPLQGMSYTLDAPLSTFSIDVDTASYSNVRRFLRDGSLPPPTAVRVEEMINYFGYDYPLPSNNEPFAISTEVGPCPWAPKHRLVQIGLRSRPIESKARPRLNLVFLVDVSGSMMDPNKLPLLQRSLSMLTEELDERDRVALVAYAGASGLVLPPTPGSERATILQAVNQLEAGGSTHGSAGIEQAYRVAQQSLVEGGINRVILATDGDFNVGVSSRSELRRLIEARRKTGIYLTVLGFGTGNLNDATMEALADYGNGNYAYIDTIAEARRALVREMGSTLVTVAEDVKLQVELNPARVRQYRLIGYDNRRLAARDFNDDKKDAGDMGAGHRVTALYEIVLENGESEGGTEVDPLRYQSKRAPAATANEDELMNIRVRFKRPGQTKSELRNAIVHAPQAPDLSPSARFAWATGIAAFGMSLREDPAIGQFSLEHTRGILKDALGNATTEDETELIVMLDRAIALRSRATTN